MKVEDLNKSKAYKKLNMSDVEKSELLEMCKSKKKELKSDIPDLSIRRTESMKKDNRNSIIKKVVFATGSIAATIAIVAGVAKYNGGKNIGKETGKVASTNMETEVSSEMTTKYEPPEEYKPEDIMDWAQYKCDTFEEECFDIDVDTKELVLMDGYEHREYESKGRELQIYGKDFVEVKGEPDKDAKDVGKRRLYFIVNGRVYKLQLDVILNNEEGDNIEYLEDYGYIYKIPGTDFQCPLISVVNNGLDRNVSEDLEDYEDHEIEELKYDKKHKQLYLKSSVERVKKDLIDENSTWEIAVQNTQNEFFKIPNLRIFDKNSKVKTIISAAKCFYDSKKHSLFYLSEERKLFELKGIDMKDYSSERVEFVANKNYKEILRLEGVCDFDVNEAGTFEISVIEGEHKEVNVEGIKMEYVDYGWDMFHYVHYEE
ncbi:hypothetical protein [Eubacterium sp.]|uniref:hypothetical protein n=1 Tax=Eubacterium sp. TaxID=142586 RepID=UPI0025F74FC3|nr:hypothetical protein [Eubacterium sp.]MCR5628674.1 hypothetical protein [Eubacterium sp.]